MTPSSSDRNITVDNKPNGIKLPYIGQAQLLIEDHYLHQLLYDPGQR